MTQTIEQLPARRNGAMQKLDPRATARDSATLKGVLESQADKIRAVLPRHLTPEKLMRVALVSVSKNKDLQECSISSILQCVMTGAQLGLDCSGVLGSAYMVPFFNKNTGMKEAQFVPGYRGLVDLARRSGQIDDIFAHCVYIDDEFDLELGGEPRLKHRPNLQTERRDEDIVGAYMVAYLKGTTRPHVEFVPRSDIEKVRRASKAGKFGPWVDWFAEMCRKTAVRRGIKYLPLSVELSEALAHDEAASEMERTEVQSASTQRGVSAMAHRLQTARPVSEGQQLVDSDTGEEIETPTESETPEPVVDDVAPEPPPPNEPPAGNTLSPREQFWASVDEVAEGFGFTDKVDVRNRVGAHLLKIGLKGRENKVSPEQKAALFEAMKNKIGAFA